MSIFVDPNAIFPIRLKFVYNLSENGVIEGVRILPDNTEDPEANELICGVVGRDFDGISRILEDATVINHYTGKPMVRSRLFARMIVTQFFRNWNIEDPETGNMVPLNNETVGTTHHTIVTALARRWLMKTSGRKTR